MTVLKAKVLAILPEPLLRIKKQNGSHITPAFEDKLKNLIAKPNLVNSVDFQRLPIVHSKLNH